MNNKLRVALLIDDFNVPYWKYKVVEDIINSNHSKVVLSIKINNKTNTSLNSFSLYNLFCKIENVLFKKNIVAFTIQSLKNIIGDNILSLECEFINLKTYFNSDDITKIKQQNIDVILSLSDSKVGGDILNVPKNGLWSYHHGDYNVHRGGPSGVWEVIENWKETGTSFLKIMENQEDNLILYQSYSTTNELSINRSKNNYFLNAISIAPRVLKKLYNLGEIEFKKDIQKKNLIPNFYYNNKKNPPSNFQMIKGISMLYFKFIKKKINSIFFFEQWILLYNFRNNNSISKSFYQFKRLLPPKGRIWGDPFIHFKNEIYYIFFEDMSIKENIGKISVIEINEKGEHTNPQIIIDEKYHLSYPFLIEEKDTLYMIPESGMNRTIDIYKCVDYPYKWEYLKNLMNNINAKDTTVFKYNGLFWLFTILQEQKGASTQEELSLFYSNDLFTENWYPHIQNPIVSDIKKARPAGNIFIHNNRIYRPAQDCSIHYGYGMRIMEIISLTKENYEEKEVQSIHPNWAKDLISTHTINHLNKLTVIDAVIKRRK
ncbi:hypothetical protein CLV91_3155 [Maribacter vaceletii]|uniref:Glucosamine inositolphosphorylceramide transferase 1 N-terminal domain-containing protein n=1 Tax=Maribacter vaceletii TaxID=1206816 RepID=A0A495DSQ2_9FLAO|nr:hypothetical protein [Maribacter vaceletii]RKR07170.1 hypothetical protein CLV91_3155 [Maribacter vaceletii]